MCELCSREASVCTQVRAGNLQIHNSLQEIWTRNCCSLSLLTLRLQCEKVMFQVRASLSPGHSQGKSGDWGKRCTAGALPAPAVSPGAPAALQSCAHAVGVPAVAAGARQPHNGHARGCHLPGSSDTAGTPPGHWLWMERGAVGLQGHT